MPHFDRFAFALAALALAVSSTPSPNLPCKAMKEYLPPHIGATYDMEKHNGTWHEVAFRDLELQDDSEKYTQFHMDVAMASLLEEVR